MKKIEFSLHLDGEACWPDLIQQRERGKLITLEPSALVSMSLLKEQPQRDSVLAIRFEVPGGKTMVALTRADLFVAAAELIRAALPGLVESTH